MSTIYERTVRIIQDENPDNPRDNDNLSIMVCFHHRYNLGDNNHDYRKEDFASWEVLEEDIWKEYEPVVIKPLYLYDHSGITISTTPFTSCWDSGQVGFVFVPKENAIKFHETDKLTKKLIKQCEEVLDYEVRVYNDYISGNVYGWQILNNGEIENSCYGFYGINLQKNDLIDSLTESLERSIIES